MENSFLNGVWPVMLTPFTGDNKVDYNALGNLVEWYIEQGVAGLFAVCQSSEMFFLSLEERLEIAKYIKKKAARRIQVIASGHVSDNLDDQCKELTLMAETGVDAVILITNRLASEKEDDEIWYNNLLKLESGLPADLKLGFYECPYPYKRVLSAEITRRCAARGRYYFLKDTSCDITAIKEKLNVTKGTNMKLFNANTTTLLESLRCGAAGFSGVMANFHADLYVKMCKEFKSNEMDRLSDYLTIFSLIERQLYPVNAKYALDMKGVSMDLHTRVKDAGAFTDTFKKEVVCLENIAKELVHKYIS